MGDERRGRVRRFDDASGLGEIDDDGGGSVAFHCVAIADGTRTIAEGTAVRFTLVAKLGRWEAAGVRPV